MLTKFSAEIVKGAGYVAYLSINGRYKIRIDRRDIEYERCG
jgi:hypothetical protein